MTKGHSLLDELNDRIWKHNEFHDERSDLEMRYLSTPHISTDPPLYLGRLVESALHLSLSRNPEHCIAAYKIAVYSWKIYGRHLLGLNTSVSVVLSRLSNFAALRLGGYTAERVPASITLPPRWKLAIPRRLRP